MDGIWREMVRAAKSVQYKKELSGYVSAGGVAAAVLSSGGKIYTGLCVDACCALGICAERSAIFSMITNGEQEIEKVVAILPNGKCIPPCGACRELMMQLMPENGRRIEILLDDDGESITTLGALAQQWWI